MPSDNHAEDENNQSAHSTGISSEVRQSPRLHPEGSLQPLLVEATSHIIDTNRKANKELFQALTNQIAETNKILSTQMSNLCNAMAQTMQTIQMMHPPPCESPHPQAPMAVEEDMKTEKTAMTAKLVSTTDDKAATKAKKTVDKADLSFLGDQKRGTANYWTGDNDGRSVVRLKTLVEAQHLYRFGNWAIKYFFCLRVLSPSIREVAALTVEGGNASSSFEEWHNALWSHLNKEYSASYTEEDSRKKLQALKMSMVRSDVDIVGAYDDYLQQFGLIRIEYLHEHVETTAADRARNSEELAHYFYQGLSDRVKGKLISVIGDSAIYKDLDSLKNITRNVCRVISKKAKSKMSSSTTSPIPIEDATTSRLLYSRPLRQSEVNIVESTLTNDHIKSCKCQRCLSHGHSTVFCPVAEMSYSRRRCRTCGMVQHEGHSTPCSSLSKGPITCMRCSGSGHFARACPVAEAKPMPAEQRKLIFDKINEKKVSVTTEISKPSQANLVSLSTSETRPSSSLTSIDVYLETLEAKIPYKQSALIDSGASHCFIHPDLIHRWKESGVSLKIRPTGYVASSSDASKDPIPIDTSVTVSVSFTQNSSSVVLKCYVYPDLSHQMLLSSSVLRDAGCLWFMLPGHADCMLLGDSAQEVRDILKGLGFQPKPLTGGTLAPDYLSLNCLNLRALQYDGFEDGWESTRRMMSYTLQLCDGIEGQSYAECYADEQEALRRCEQLASSEFPAKDRDLRHVIEDLDSVVTKCFDIHLQRDPVGAPDGRPVVRVPWKSDARPPVNGFQAMRCDRAIMRKLTTEKKEQFCEKVDEFISLGFCSPTSPAKSLAELESYLQDSRSDLERGAVPLPSVTGRFIRAFCVNDPVSVTTPIRVVLDARAENSFTFAFPVGKKDSPSSLEANLLYWRGGKFYFSMDISKAFLSLGIHPIDRPYCGMQGAGRTLQFNSVYFGAGWAPRALQESTDFLKVLWQDELRGDRLKIGAAIKYLPLDEARPPPPIPLPPVPSHQPDPTDIDLLKLYLDDVVASGNDRQRLMGLRSFTRYKFSRHGLYCNPEKDDDNLDDKTTPSEGREDTTARHLGYSYLPVSDHLVMAYGTGRGSCLSSLPSTILTKAQAVSILSALFDPIGLWSECSNGARILLRKIAQSNVCWSLPIPDELDAEIRGWRDIALACKYNFPRHLDFASGGLVGFSDSSGELWCCDVRVASTSGVQATTFNRVICKYGYCDDPKGRPRTIVLKELDALARLCDLLQHVETLVSCMPIATAIKPHSVTLFCDSEIVIWKLLNYGKSKGCLPRFEENRLKRIHDYFTGSNRYCRVYHISGDGNPSDRPTRPNSEPMPDAEIDIAVQNAKTKNFVFDTSAAKLNSQTIFSKKSRSSPKKVLNVEIIDDAVLQAEILQSQKLDEECRHIVKAFEGLKEDKVSQVSRSRQLRDKVVVDGIVRLRTLDWSDESAPKIGGCKFLIPNGDKKLQLKILRRCHDLKKHCGVSAFKRYVGARFHWKKLKADCKHHVEHCPITDRERTPQNLNKAFGGSATWRSGFRPMECWGIDICGPFRRLASDDGWSDDDSISSLDGADVETYILTATCIATGYLMTRTMPRKSTDACTKALCSMIASEDYPFCIVSDQDKAFCSREFQATLASFPFKVQHLVVPRFSPWLRGWYERQHQDFVKALRASINHEVLHQEDWSGVVQSCTRSLNVTPYSDVSPLAPWHLIKSYPSRHDVTDHEHADDYKSRMGLLSPRWYEDLGNLYGELRDRRVVTLKGYLDFWRDRRDELYRRALLDRGSDHREAFTDGCTAYRWAPRGDKLSYQWHGPYIFRGFSVESKAMGIIEDPKTGTKTVESMLNLKKSNAAPASSCSIDDGLPPFPVGTRISMLFTVNGSDEFYDGVVERVKDNGLLTVLFDDGERCDDIDPHKEGVKMIH
ncbi:hypothetical protein Pmar_PMAR006389 [Perkinsus marinus ATCC 50983]|uniref:Uncharacterized protein n=1 Tax=Perkinsus marinus (strain ATCC 50983 / TXsc) TaxID=423536 RepID=C5K9J7_PERM5|nr:hypothetical protein Pmar_PMAR006389 [Perkinsus marinus ATCC 50983]EER18769.1 hypothetical protein Pmar_PMAR006389 [Perkinsus marinus ATCC 50983]|eukprot:XP_002786973.1 hypothetical protein Pmar_PMAR006389 [Perkinsus marinus ATCC 50983]